MPDTTAERRGGCILQFAKAPVPGRVKTRLQPDYSPADAAAIAAELTTLVAAALVAVSDQWRVEFAVDDVEDPFLAGQARRFGRELVAQGEGDLGARMAHAGQAAIARHGRVIIVGSDCLGYDPAYLAAAIASLERGRDAVLGPASDGGYVLVGFNRFDATVFDSIAWGTAAVLEAQRCNLRALAWDWDELPLRADIDTPADIRQAVGKGLLGREWLRRG